MGIRLDVKNDCETALMLSEINLYKNVNHFQAKGTGIGFISLTHIQNSRKRDQVSKICVLNFKKC